MEQMIVIYPNVVLMLENHFFAPSFIPFSIWKKYRMLYEAIIANLMLIKVPTLVSITNSSPLTIFLTRRAVLWCASRHCCALKDGASWHLKDFQWHLGWPLSRWKIKVLKCLLSTCLRPWHHSPPSTAAADNCRFCFQSGNAWSVIARGGLQQSEKLIISYQIPLSIHYQPFG